VLFSGVTVGPGAEAGPRPASRPPSPPRLASSARPSVSPWSAPSSRHSCAGLSAPTSRLRATPGCWALTASGAVVLILGLLATTRRATESARRTARELNPEVFQQAAR
jgi:hypothetical protein